MAANDSTAIPIKNQAYRVYFPIMDADGDLVSGALGVDSEISKDGVAFIDVIAEAIEIAPASGMYYLDLTATEMDADSVVLIVKTTTPDAKTTPMVLYPAEPTDIIVDLEDIKGVTFDTATDSLEAIRDRGDIAWLTGAGGSSPTVEQIRQEMDDNSVDLNTIVTNTSGLPTLAEIEASTVLAKQEDLLRAIGLMQENHFMDNTVYDGANNLTSARIRLYGVAGSVGTDNDVIATYTVTAVYTGMDLDTFGVVRI